MAIDIYIREKSGKREIRIPLIPEEIKFPRGDATFITNEIMGLGEVVTPSGTELGGYSWSSEFPGMARKDDPMIRGAWQDPKNYDSILSDWKKNGTELNILATGYPINADVYLKGYSPTAAGAFGDIYYEISFVEIRKVTVITSAVNKPATTEPTRPTSAGKTYTIKAGDTLWGIAKKFYNDGSKWGVIYTANKDIIEATAKKHGRSSSENGHWIYAGVTLTIPDAGSSDTSSAATAKKSVDEIAREVIQGKWGNGSARKQRLEAAGYDYSAVQSRVNQLMK